MRRRSLVAVAIVGAVATAGCGAAWAVPRAAASQLRDICGAALVPTGAVDKACSGVSRGARGIKARKELLGGHLGGGINAALGEAAGKVVGVAGGAVALAAITSFVLDGAKFALHETASVLGTTSSPQLDSTWFSSTYWRVAGISVLLTLPFLFAAAVQALLRSDLALLARAAFGYLPLAMLAVSIAAPVTMLLLAASDQMSAIVSSATGNSSNSFISFSTGALSELTVATGPFMAFFVGLFIIAGAFVLWIELLMREAAVYVIVLMLPLAFAAMVWPARRIWALRSVELLAALVLSKFAIVAVLSLGGAALSSGASVTGHSLTAALAGIVLLLMGAFTPWALLRMLPLAEIAASASSSLASQTRTRARPAAVLTDTAAHDAADWALATTAWMKREASCAAPVPPNAGEGLDASFPRARPQGGQGAAPRHAEAGTAAWDAQPLTEGAPEPVEEDTSVEPDIRVCDVGIDEMHEHPGRWELLP